jgi:sugar lactone lactonase YvrE
MLRSCHFVAFTLLVCLPSAAQVPFENGYSLKEVTGGLKGPSSIARDAGGRVYVASIYDEHGSGNPTDIFRVLPDGTVELFTAPILDPDVLCLDGEGYVYVGSWPGKVTLVNPSTGAQSTWISDSKLGNIDGMAFDGNGDLLVTAIDHHRVHRVDHSTKAITVFADLSALGLQGFGSIVVDLADQSVFVASPKDGDLVHLNPDGSLASAAFASGFQHMGQLALDASFVYVSDNVAGAICKVNRSTGQVSTFVNRIEYYAGGLLALDNGSFLATRQSMDMTDGRLYTIQPMSTSLAATPSIGSSLVLDMESPSDAGRAAFLFLYVAPGSIPLVDGRCVPVDLSAFVLLQSMFDTTGLWRLTLPIPNDSGLVGLQVYTCFLSYQSGIFGISKSHSFTIQ